MSYGQKKDKGSITGNDLLMNNEEFIEVCQDVHDFLIKRADKSKSAYDREKDNSKKNARLKEYLRCSKELYAYVRLMELCGNLGLELMELKSKTGIKITSKEKNEVEKIDSFTLNDLTKKKILN